MANYLYFKQIPWHDWAGNQRVTRSESEGAAFNERAGAGARGSVTSVAQMCSRALPRSHLLWFLELAWLPGCGAGPSGAEQARSPSLWTPGAVGTELPSWFPPQGQLPTKLHQSCSHLASASPSVLSVALAVPWSLCDPAEPARRHLCFTQAAAQLPRHCRNELSHESQRGCTSEGPGSQDHG